MKRILAVGLLCFNLMACNSEDATERASDNEAARLIGQASEHIQQGEYLTAMAPMTDAIALAPDNTEYRLLHCLLLERTGTAVEETRNCYAAVVDRFSKDAALPCDQDMNCVIASLLAQGDQAEATKEAFLAHPAPQTEAEMRRYVLDDFDRHSYLNTIFP